MFWKKKKPVEVEIKKEKQKKTDFFETFEDDYFDDLNAIHQWNIDNAIQQKPSGYAMDSFSEAAYTPTLDRINQSTLSYFIQSSSFIGYQAMSIIGQHWLVSKACKQKVRDALKKGFELTTIDGNKIEKEELEKIRSYDKKFHLKENIIKAVGFNNIFGIRHILFKHKNPNFDYEAPFNPDSFKDNDYEGMVQIDPYWIFPALDQDDMSDPMSSNFYNPEYWLVKDRKIHKSHFIVLKGEDVSDFLKPTYRYGGISMCQRIYERVYAADRTANEAPRLVMSKRLNARKVDLAKAAANKEMFVKNIMQANKFRDNHGWLLYGNDEEILQMETSLAQLSDVITNQFELVCSIVDVPVSKLMGTGHKGLGTGETDEDYYVSSLEAMQTDVIDMIINAHYDRMMPSKFNRDNNLSINWNPMKVMSAKDVADMNYVKSQTALNEFNIGAIDGYDERDRLIKDQYSQYNGIEEKDADELLPPDNFTTPDNANGSGASSQKDVNGKQQRDPSKNGN